MKLASALLSSFVLVTLAGCSKPTPEEQKKKEDELAKALGSMMSAATTSSAATPTAAAVPGTPGKILAQCLNKNDNLCKEFSGVLGLADEEVCKGLDKSGVFTKGEVTCPKEGVLATCESTGGEQTVKTYTYADKTQTPAAQRESAKTVCGFTDGKYAEVQLAGGGAGGAGGAPAKKAAAPAAKAKK